MSFILDALKKSDNSREQTQVPNLQTIHEPPPPKKKARRAAWPYLLVAALLVNAAVLVWWLGTGEEALVGEEPPPATRIPQQPEPVSEPVSPAVPQVTEVPAVPLPKPPQVEPAAVTPAVAKTGPRSSQVQSTLPVVTEPVKSQAAAPAVDGLHEWEDLPPRVRSSIPHLGLSVHFYTEAPARRMVRINGRILRQGQSVAEGVVLEEIVAEGVILSSQGYRFLVFKPRSESGD